VTDLDRDARHILELTRRARTPTADDKVRVDRRLAGALLLGATSAQAGNAATSKVVAGTLSAKWGAVALLAVAGAAAYAGLHSFRGAAPSTTATQVAAAEPSVATAADAPVPGAGSTVEAPASAAVEAPVSAATKAPTNVAASDGPDVARSAPKHTPRATLPEELDLLHDAQAKWRAGNATAALALLGEHRSLFPHSELAPERDALTVLSLCATNRTAEAKRLAQRFLKHARNSPLRSAVEESCGGK
jgi:hypothetical protein